MKTKKIVGIIGGMGPTASAHFYEMLIGHAQKEFGINNNEDFPEIILFSIPVPDFISDEKREQEALQMITDRLKSAESMQITFYCLACNTAHLLLDKLRKATNKPFVSLIYEVPKFIKRKKIKKVGLLATPTTIRTGLYTKPLEERGIKVIYPDRKDILNLGNIIKDTIGNRNFKENNILIQKIARRLLDRGAEAILETCTEIPLIFPKQHLVPVFDSLEILSLAVLKKYYLLK